MLHNKLPQTFFTVSVGQASAHSTAGSSWGLTRLQSSCQPQLGSYYRLDCGKFCSQFPEVVARIHFLIAIGFMTACFFKPSNGERRETLESASMKESYIM